MRASFFRKFFFFFFVLGISGYAFFEYSRTTKEEILKEKKSTLILDSLKDIQEIKVKTKKEEFTLAQEAGKWMLVKPLKDIVDFNELSYWFGEFKKQKIVKIKSGDSIDWKSYFLDKPLKMEWTLHSGKVKTLFFSSKSNFDGQYFVKKENSLFLGSRFLGQSGMNKDKDELRSKKIISSSVAHPHQIIIKGKEKLILNWQDYKWSLEGHQNFPLDSARLDGFWTDLTLLTAFKIVAPVTSLQKRKHGISKAPLKIILKFGDTNLVLQMSSIKSKRVFILNSNRKYILEISKKDAEKLMLTREAIRKKEKPNPSKK